VAGFWHGRCHIAWSKSAAMLTEIAPSIFLVEGGNRGQFPFSHSILIRDEVIALIDTGCGIERLQRLRQEYPPDLVINSHAHPDHIAGNWLFTGLPLLVPRESFDYCGRIQEMSQRFTGPEILAQMWRKYIREATGFRDALPTDHYQEGHRFRFGSVELLALHCPGHTVDSYCFLEPRLEILFSFDIDLTPFGPWYGHPSSDIARFEASIRRVQDLKPRMVVSSHVGVITDRIEERLQAYLDVFSQRDVRILEFLSQERRLEEMVDRPLIYRDFPYAPELLRLWEKNMLEKHLDRLIERGLVQETEKGYIRTSLA
jgi:glyoxylase-like metal-dependent hydrolase (beta-lactamase superfamily II)